MIRGFFSESDALKLSTPRDFFVPKCGACGLYKKCESPRMPVSGQGKRKILVIAEAPGADEDKHGTQLIGRAGQYLRSVLRDYGVELDRDCWKTNAIICRPPDNRKPSAKEIDYCRPNLNKTVDELKPRVILLLGDSAVNAAISPMWRENVGAVGRWIGWRIPSQKHKAWLCPTYHPSYILRSEDDTQGPVIKLLFRRHVKNALQLDCEVPDLGDLKDHIRVMFDTDKAAKNIRKMIQKGGMVSFDYETNRLKPDSHLSEIVCCSVCWRGKRTISYPWAGEAIKATKELLTSDLPKIGANTKFEDRWSRAKLGVAVENWKWDTVLSAHHLDNRGGISSVKFQALVRLGIPSYDGHIRPYLENCDPETGVNRIKELNQHELLLYCGIDSFVEYKIAECQRQEMCGHG